MKWRYWFTIGLYSLNGWSQQPQRMEGFNQVLENSTSLSVKQFIVKKRRLHLLQDQCDREINHKLFPKACYQALTEFPKEQDLWKPAHVAVSARALCRDRAEQQERLVVLEKWQSLSVDSECLQYIKRRRRVLLYKRGVPLD